MPLDFDTWNLRALNHAQLISPLADAFVQRRETGKTHAVHDFLFVYYTCSPQKLKQWVPSFEDQLIVSDDIREAYPWLTDYWFKIDNAILFLNSERIQDNTRGIAKFVLDLCRNIANQPPRFGCYGLHEWAMVYKLSQQDVRHAGQRLRLSPEELAQFVESQTLCCTHYDAYRFFTPEARVLNILNPQLDTRLQMEQGGCLHANMDIYKWSIKLWPWIGSDFMAKAFLSAVEGREMDMRASPYDLKEIGFEPICIETEAGRKEYQLLQQAYAEKAATLRLELGQWCERFLKI